MFRKKSKKQSKKIDEARDVSIREREGDANGPTPNGHVKGEPDPEQDDHGFTEELHTPFDEETEEIWERERAFNVVGNHETRPATEDEAADKVNTFWLQRLGDDPQGALDDLQARVEQLGYQLAFAGRTFGAPVIKRTYYIIDTDKGEPIDAFQDRAVELTLLDVCLWSELAFKKWKNS
jgi:hypothetical protein